MGILFSHVALLAQAKQAGACFDRLLTIGHQQSYLSQYQIQRLAMRYGPQLDATVLAREKYVDISSNYSSVQASCSRSTTRTLKGVRLFMT